MSEQEKGLQSPAFPVTSQGVCENTPCFLGADCRGTSECAVVNSFYRITSRAVKPMRCIVAPGHHIGWGFLLHVIKCVVVSLTLTVLGIYVPRPIGPFWAKNISHAHRTGKCAKHFLLLDTSASQNLSPLFPSFSPHPFYSPSSSLFPLLLIPRSIPLSLSFLPPLFFFSRCFRGLLTPQPMARC